MRAKMSMYFLFISILIAATSCHHKITTTATSISQASTEQKVQQVPAILIPHDYSNVAYNGLRHADAVFELYSAHEYQPFWLEKNLKLAQADSMIAIINAARRYGLLPPHYHFHEIPMLVSEPVERAKMVRLDIILTDAFLSMAHDLKKGRQHDPGFRLDTLKSVLLSDTLKAKNIRQFLAVQEPAYEGYLALKKALNNLLDTVNLLDRNLLLQGITNDSIDIHRKVQRIEINLERWRIENESLIKIYTWINIPAYMFYVVDNNEVVMESRVIVGTPATPTPVFSSNIECFTIYPYWYVPRKITVQEYLPVLKQDTTFITRNNFDVLDRSGKIQDLSSINWNLYTPQNFPFTLRQREGKENSLGIIKFVFDNPYAVFLHDTNSKRLFRNNTRAYSHGCIRLEKAVEFSHYLIGEGRTKISSQTLDKYLKAQKRLTINLLHAVPIHIRYFTSEAREGKLLFYADIYKKDGALIRAVYKTPVF